MGVGTSLHTYSYTTTQWGTTAPADVSLTFTEAPFLLTNGAINTELSDLSLNVKFLASATLTEGDTWTIIISSCGADSPLQEGMSATLTSVDGTAAVGQLTLDRGYEGTVPGSHDVYSVNQHFTVRASGERREGALPPERAFVGSVEIGCKIRRNS